MFALLIIPHYEINHCSLTEEGRSGIKKTIHKGSELLSFELLPLHPNVLNYKQTLQCLDINNVILIPLTYFFSFVFFQL